MTTALHDRPLRWGIIGTGAIASAFATDLEFLPDAEIVSVGSRTSAGAEKFGNTHGIPRRYASYAELVADELVDAVYVATPHPLHHKCALLAIAAGKAVLVEKPFALNAEQASEVVAAAQARGTFAMEAMWTRFLPHIVRVRELIAAGRLGEVRSLQADFGEQFLPDPGHRAFAPQLGGGALLDLGIYPVSFASMLFGTPTHIAALSHPTFSHVDSQTAVLLMYREGQLAVLLTSLETVNGNTAHINGTKARIEIEGDFLAPTRFRLIEPDGRVEIYDQPHQGRGLRHQAAEVARCLRARLLESPIIPLGETLSIMQTLDEIRSHIGLVYPGEHDRADPDPAPVQPHLGP